MANAILTPQMITDEAVDLFKNSNAFIANIDTQYDDQFAIDGAKIGETLRIRLPNDYVVSTGAAASAQDTNEQFTSLSVSTQQHVDMSFSTRERTMSIQDYSERVLQPAMNNLAGAVAINVMSGVEGGVCNFAANLDGSNNVTAITSTAVLRGKAALENNSTPTSPKRKFMVDPDTEAVAVASFSTLFNPSKAISDQYLEGSMGTALGFEWYMDQTVIKHTTGTFTAGTVNGAGQTGNTLVTNAITGTLTAGDFITIALVNGVNRVTKATYGSLRQFCVTANVASGATSIPIYPAIVPAVAGNAVQYQTVTVSPANSAVISLVTAAGSTYRKNIAFSPKAITLATADLVMPKGVHEVARSQYDGISMRLLTDYIPGTDQLLTRVDVLYGFVFIRPEWVVAVGNVL